MTAPLDTRPDTTEHASFYAGYVAAVPDGNILATLRRVSEELNAALQSIPESKGEHRYADGKWSVRMVIGHMIDAERIFAYRALRVARGDATPLPGFDENSYANASNAGERTVADLATEMAVVRSSTVRLFESFPDEAWPRRGVASNTEVSARALAWITAGHALHHLRVLRERYGI